MSIRCMIIDDEPIACKGMEEYITEVEFLSIVNICDSAVKAYAFLHAEKVDLIFLDIEMPKLTGIEFLQSLKKAPAVIITTAYPDYALQGYELDVIDYLVKPVSFPRFLKAANKAKDFLTARNTPRENVLDKDHFFLKVDSKFEKIFYDEVLYFEALQNYVAIHLPGKKMISYITISYVESKLPEHLFMRVHKSYLVSLSKIQCIEGNTLIINDKQIPVSRNLKEKLKAEVVDKKLFKRQ
ncbi:MAG: response regulator transcription factor [Segetibacter sp.]|nr:response regulator transcription factor [Segetibacter sp.]